MRLQAKRKGLILVRFRCHFRPHLRFQSQLLDIVYMRMKYAWKRRKMSREQLEWLERLYGHKESKRQHYEYENSRGPIYFRNDEEREQHNAHNAFINKLIKDLDKEIVYRYTNLLVKYKDTMDNYHFIINYLINEIIYPRFLRMEHKVKA